MRFGLARRADPLVDITPMIDIVFQLVLFFMVSTTFIDAPGIQVDLPQASEQDLLSERDDVEVWMTADGAVHVNDHEVELATLEGLLHEAHERDPSTLVVIKADEGVAHGRVVMVMDMARSTGLTRLAIGTDVAQERGDI